MDQEQKVRVFKRCCDVREFEKRMIDHIQGKIITTPCYLGMGQEIVPSVLAEYCRDWNVFPQHRCHGLHIAFGTPLERIRDELLLRPTGTSGGRAGSNCLQWHEGGLHIHGHHGLSGENVPLGVGHAFATGTPSLCIFGDGAAEEDYVLSAIGYAQTHKLPVLFVCEDNDLCVLTKKKERRSWKLADVAGGFGMYAFETSSHHRVLDKNIFHILKYLPALINISVNRERWHVGAGIDKPVNPKDSAFEMLKEELQVDDGFNTYDIEHESSMKMRSLWQL